MSGRLVTAVLESALHPSLKPTATTLASLARDDGTRLYPSVAYLAWLRGKSARLIQRDLAALRAAQVLVVVRPAAPDRPALYRFDAAALPVRTSWNARQPGLPFTARDGMTVDRVKVDPEGPPTVRDTTPTSPLATPASSLTVDRSEFSTGTNRCAPTKTGTGGVTFPAEETTPMSPDPSGSVRDPVRTEEPGAGAPIPEPEQRPPKQVALPPMDVSAPGPSFADQMTVLREQFGTPRPAVAKLERRRVAKAQLRARKFG